MDLKEAANMVQGPLMTLIGGSLAIAKDLIQVDSSGSDDQLDRSGDEQDRQTKPQ